MGQILDGRSLANMRARKLKRKVMALRAKKIVPLFCVINIGQNRASQTYLRMKARRARQVGIVQRVYQLPVDITELEVTTLIDRLNHNPKVNGIMIQLPIPSSLNGGRLLAKISPEKDIDCLTPTNIGRLWQQQYFVQPATPAGIIALLHYYKIQISGQNVVILGRSAIVGKPLAALMLGENATISVLHSRTRDITIYTYLADILISAVGRPDFVTADMIKKGATVIDVGINYLQGHLVGDVAFSQVKAKAGWITPVPGGVGPLTVEFLLEQVVKLTRRAHGRR